MVRARNELLPMRSRRLLFFGFVLLVVLLPNGTSAVRSPHSISSVNSPTSVATKPETTNTEPILATKTKALPRGGGGGKLQPVASKQASALQPSLFWAVLHNWLYFLSLGFNLINIPYMVREIVDGPGTTKPSAASIALSGNVEALDKLLTFGGVAFLAALSDKFGRKPLIAWSSFGFCLTNLIQVFAGKAPTPGISKALLYLADFVDGCSSCMSPVCQAYVADCTAPSNLASQLGVFQGISIGGAFMFAFPIGGLLGAKYGPKLPILLAAAIQLVNGLLATFVTPESNVADKNNNKDRRINLSEVNPITGLKNLFGIGGATGFGTSSVGLLRTASLTYLCLCMAQGALDAQFVNYSNIRFGWTQAQSGPVLVMTGLMLAVVPRVLVPMLGLQRSINFGLLVYALGLSSSGLVSTSMQFVASIAIVAIGCVSIPALQALLANLAPPGQSGVLLGAVRSMNELSAAIGSSMYATILGTFATGSATALSPLKELLPVDLPGMHFLVGAAFCLLGWAVSSRGLVIYKDHPSLAKGIVSKEPLV